MPIRPEHRFFYPIDWRELSMAIRFGPAQGGCESCGRPPGQLFYNPAVGGWWEAEAGGGREGGGARIRSRWVTVFSAGAGRPQAVRPAATGNNNRLTKSAPNPLPFGQPANLTKTRPSHRRRRRPRR
ncbi:hypothetical protein MKK67_29130, partial [Methylobacterium sp. J-072]|uniref:hypothetical protein n=1 Tax=Methylobacterium sp. J-072 TaxID=2836651 RepID=UPI001FBA429E